MWWSWTLEVGVDEWKAIWMSISGVMDGFRWGMKHWCRHLLATPGAVIGYRTQCI